MAEKMQGQSHNQSMSFFTIFRHFFLVISFAIFGYYYYNNYLNTERQRVNNVLKGLLLEEQRVNLSTEKPVAVGFGSCVDIFTHGIPLVNALGIKPPAEAKYHNNIETLQDVAEMFAFFLSNGAAAERYISQDLLDSIVRQAEKIEGAYYTVGGNAPVISNRFAMEGFTVHVGAKGSEKMRHLYHKDMHFSQGFGEGDDVHLIMEYKVGERWGPYEVKRANRFILHSDNNNPELRSMESFIEVVDRVKPKVIVIGGLQMLDNYKFEAGVREERMQKMRDWLKRLPSSIKIHFEMASFGEVDMMKSLIENIVPYVDSLGMNEQELPNIESMVRGGDIIEVADSNPRTAAVLDHLRSLISHVEKESVRGLSRVHVHTLAYQAIWTKKDSAWRNTRAGCAKASLVAHRHVCGVSEIVAENAKLLMDDSFSLTTKNDDKKINFNEHSPISCWNEKENEICIAPVLVCTKVKQTAGGGDNITPAGIMPQL